MIKGFGEEKQKKLIDYIESEIEQMSSDRSTLLDDIRQLNDVYEGRIPEKTYPWEGCSNIQVPLISTHVDALLANMMNSVFQNENYWTVNPITPDTWGYAKETERLLQYGSNHVFKMYEVCQDWFKGGIKDGTGIITLNWREEYRWRYSKIDEDYVAEPKLMFRGPKIESIPLENFYIPHRFPVIQRAPWCGHDFYLSWPEIKGE
jgi:hypothetical protein